MLTHKHLQNSPQNCVFVVERLPFCKYASHKRPFVNYFQTIHAMSTYIALPYHFAPKIRPPR